jgi:hypothetical protein
MIFNNDQEEGGQDNKHAQTSNTNGTSLKEQTLAASAESNMQI